MCRSARADLARHIGARCGNRSGKGGQQALRLGMRGNTQGNFIKAGAGQSGNRTMIFARQHKCHRPWPEDGGQRCRNGGFAAKSKSCIDRSHMADQGVEFGSVLRGKNTGHSICVAGVGTQAVDGFGGECNKSTAAQDAGGIGDALVR